MSATESSPAPPGVPSQYAPHPSQKDTQWTRAWRQLRRNRLAMVCLGVIAVYVVMWLVAECMYWPPILCDKIEQSFGEKSPRAFLVAGIFCVMVAGLLFWRQWWKTAIVAAVIGVGLLTVTVKFPNGKVLDKNLREFADIQAPYKRSDDNARNLPSTITSEIPSDWKRSALAFHFSHVLGTDFAGHDNFLRLMQGGRICFEIAICVALITFSLGFTLGAVAGYFGGWIDDTIVYVYSIFASVPDILLVIAIAYVTGKLLPADKFYLVPIALGLGLTGWVGLCRLIRGEYIKLRERPYVLAATSLGATHRSIMFKHIAPNVMHLLVINFTLAFPGMILSETVLTYLGIGIQTEPSWGNMINDARQRIWIGNWWEIGGILLCMFFFVLSLNLFGDALRDALDPKLHTAKEGK